MNNLCGRAIEHIYIVVPAGIGPHTAATAGAGGCVKGGLLRRKSLTIVNRARHPDSPIRLALSSRRWCVPEHVHIARVVGGDCASTIQTVSSVDHIALRLELGP